MRLVPPLASGYRRTPDARMEQSERSSPVRYERSASFSTSMGGGATGPSFDLAIGSKLRGCDLVKIRIGDIFCNRKIRARARSYSIRPADRFNLS